MSAGRFVDAASEGERRWATVLFADLSNFTQLAEKMDPEEVRLLVDGCTREMGEIIDRYGGWVDKVIGDELMAVFGAPVTHEDDAERAVRAGLELQRYAAEHADDLAGLPLKVGVQTGEVMFAPVGPGQRRAPTVTGDTVNTAQRLQAAAPNGAVLIGEETECSCRAAIRCDRAEPVVAKGKEAPIRVWLAQGTTTPTVGRVPFGPMLGRDTELELLRSIWERVAVRGESQLVSILGSPGIGKTRLCRELVSFVVAHEGQVVRGRSLPYGESTGYGGFTRMLRSVAEIFETDSPDAARDKLRRRIETLVRANGSERVLAHLSLLAGLTDHSVDDRSALFSSVRDFIEALAGDKPTLFVFEDVQWADPSLLDLIESIATHVREAPAMFVALARQELLDARPSWGGGIPRYTGVSLDPLPSDESRQLAHRLLGDTSDPDAAAEEIERSAGGNPLFIEELAAAMAEGTAKTMQELPVTLRTIVAARLDALPPQERGLMLDASVVGSVFWRGTLERLGGEEVSVSQSLKNLEFRDFIRRHRVSRMEGDEEFAFKHGLIRDVAYATLPKAARRKRHALVAGFLEEAAGSSTNIEPIIAHHWREAGESARAVPYLLTAAEHAGRGWAQAEAVTLYNQVLNLLPEDDATYRHEIMLRRAVAYARYTHTLHDVGDRATRAQARVSTDTRRA